MSRRAAIGAGPMSRRAAMLLGGVGIIAVAALVATGVALGHRTDQVAAIDGHPVTRDELIFHMRRLAPVVRNELRNEYRLPAPIDWTAKAGDKTALRRLTDRALEEIWRDKATLILAKEQGLVDSVDHADFLAELAEENERRAEAIDNGETIYGLTEFSPEEYYSHRLTELRTSLKKRLSATAGDPLWVSEEEVRRAFDADREAWSANATRYAYSKLVVPVPADAPPDYVTSLHRRVAAAGRLADAAAREPGARLTTATHDGRSPTAPNSPDRDLVAVLRTLAPGQISGPVAGTHQITFYQLDGKTVDERAALADYSRRIRQSLIDEKFTQFLQRRVDDSAIEVDTAAVDAINPEDVQQ